MYIANVNEDGFENNPHLDAVRAIALAEGAVVVPGARTVTDMLNAQQDVVVARVRNLTAQRDRVIASFTLLAAIGRLGMTQIGITILKRRERTADGHRDRSHRG